MIKDNSNDKNNMVKSMTKKRAENERRKKGKSENKRGIMAIKLN